MGVCGWLCFFLADGVSKLMLSSHKRVIQFLDKLFRRGEKPIDAINRSRIGTIVCVPLTSNTRWASAPGNVLLRSSVTGLPKDSVANISLIAALDRSQLTERGGKLPERHVTAVINGIDEIFGR